MNASVMRSMDGGIINAVKFNGVTNVTKFYEKKNCILNT